MSVLSADELRAMITEERQRIGRLMQEHATALEEIEAAQERKKLREQLAGLASESDTWLSSIHSLRGIRLSTDCDHVSETSHITTAAGERQIAKSSLSYDAKVAKGEFVWEIKGLSWLPHALEQERRNCTASAAFNIDTTDIDSRYRLAFSPNAAGLDHGQDEECESFHGAPRGTLALIRRASQYGTNLDVSFFVQSPNGSFAQWGERERRAWRNRDDDDDEYCIVIGPDLEHSAKGVFGLAFDELLNSQWVKDDRVVFKVVIEEVVMRDLDVTFLGETSNEIKEAHEVEVPPPTLAVDMLAMLAEGRYSDLTIEVAYDGESPVQFSAHMSILAQRSDVFRAALTHSLQERETKLVRVCDVPLFAMTALLYFLYSDSFEPVQKVLCEEIAGEASSGASLSDRAAAGANAATGGRHSAASGASTSDKAAQWVGRLKGVLVAAHKYQVMRLLRWCERQLCQELGAGTVCELLGLAQLYGASELAECCLKWMQAHQAEVVSRPEFAALSSEALVRFNMHCAGVEPADKEGLSSRRKRKRGDE